MFRAGKAHDKREARAREACAPCPCESRRSRKPRNSRLDEPIAVRAWLGYDGRGLNGTEKGHTWARISISIVILASAET